MSPCQHSCQQLNCFDVLICDHMKITTPTASLKYLCEDVIGDLLPTSHSLDPLLNTVTANPPHGTHSLMIHLCLLWVQQLQVCGHTEMIHHNDMTITFYRKE